MNFQFNVSPQTIPVPAPRPDPDAPLFASEDGLVAALSSNECIFQVKRSGEPHVMTFQVLQALDQCREFRSLDEHVARIQTTIPGLAAKRDEVRRVLDSLVQRRLLVADRDFIATLAAAALRVQAPLRAVFIRACDRPVQLARLLATLTEYERRSRAGRHYVVLDESTESANVDRQRDLLREFARATGCKVGYVGAAERSRLVDRLVKSLPGARDALASLLQRPAERGAAQRFGGGRGWNLALLLSAGTRMVLFDDDLRLPLRRPEGIKPGLDLNPNAQPGARFQASIEEALGSGEEFEGDPFELHLDACGQALGNLTRSAYPIERTALRGLNLSRLEHLHGNAHIIATQHGSYGSSRTETGLWLYQLDADSRADFWRDRPSYLRNVEAQHLWFGVAQARVANVVNFTPFAFDNSALLPCTNPVGRGEDGLFSAVALFCHPDALVLDLPVAIGHVQEAGRKRAEKTLAAHTPRFNHFVRDYVQRQLGVFKAADPAQRLRLLAEVLRDLAGASAGDRGAHLREYLSYVRADVIDRLQHQIEAATDAPVYWQADVRTIIQNNAKALLAKAAPRLGDWPEEFDDAACANALSAELSGLADAFTAWPQVWRHAAEQGGKLLSAL